MRGRRVAAALLGIFLLTAVGPVFGQAAGWEQDPETQQILRVLAADPRNVDALNSYGIVQAKANDLIGAIRTWRYALGFAPRYVHLFNNIGSALRRLGYSREAYEWYCASLRVQPTYWTWYNLGLLLEDLRYPSQALQAYAGALRLFPGFTVARERFLRVQRLMSLPPPASVPTAPPALPGRTPRSQPPPPESGREKPPVVAQIVTQGEAEAAVESTEEPALPRSVPPQPRVRAQAPVSGGETFRLHLPGDSGGQVFLTFDGGAEADGLAGILVALKGRNLHSTFFLTGQWVKSYPDLARQILADGHEIANHSMKHPNMSGWSREQIAAELSKTEGVFQAVLGRRAAPFFRFPFGAQNARVEKIVEELGYRPVYWHIDTLDWKEPSVNSILTKVRNRIRRGAVILMHVGSRHGSQALPAMLDDLLVRGYRPDRLSSLDPAQLAALP